MRQLLLVWLLQVTFGQPVYSGDMTATWLGGSGNWTDPGNWDTDPLFPDNGNGGSTFDVGFGFADSDHVIVDQDITIDTIAFLEPSRPFRDARIDGSSNLTLVGIGSKWTGGRMVGSGMTIVDNDATLDIDATRPFPPQPVPAQPTLYGRTLVNRGVINTVSVGYGTVEAGQSGTVNNEQSAIFDVQNNMTFGLVNPFAGVDSATFNNNGIFRKSGGAGEDGTLFAWAFNNSGTVDVETGVLYLREGTSTGTFSISPNATLSLAGHTLDQARLSNNGDVRFDHWFSNPTTITQDISIGGHVSIAGNVTSNGNMTLHTLRWEQRTLSGGGTVTIPTGGEFAVTPDCSGNCVPTVDPTLDGYTVNNHGTTSLSTPRLGKNAAVFGINGAEFINNVGALFRMEKDVDLLREVE